MAAARGLCTAAYQRLHEGAEVAVLRTLELCNFVPSRARLKPKLIDVVAQHRLVRQRRVDFTVDGRRDVDRRRHFDDPTREIPALVNAVRRQTFVEVFRMVFVELRGPVGFVHRVRHLDVVLIVFVECAVRIERHHRVRTHASDVIDEPLAQRNFARIAQAVGFPAEFDDLVDAENVRSPAHLRGVRSDRVGHAHANGVVTVVGNAQHDQTRAAICHQPQRAAAEQRCIVGVRDDDQHRVTATGQFAHGAGASIGR